MTHKQTKPQKKLFWQQSASTGIVHAGFLLSLLATLPSCAMLKNELQNFSDSLSRLTGLATQAKSEKEFDKQCAESLASLKDETKSGSFFTDLMGVPESEFGKPENLKKNIVKRADGTFIIKSMHPKPVWYKAGAFKAWDIKDLRQEMVKREKEKSLKKSDKPGTFNILGPHVGVGALETSGKNKQAVIMVASNFNAIVDIGAKMLEVTHYPSDPTQEQRATLVGLPGILLRYFYGLYSDQEPDPAKWRQVSDTTYIDSTEPEKFEKNSQQIHLLTGPGISVKDGYVKFVPTKKLADAFDAGTISNKIGYHRDIQIVLSGTDKQGDYGILQDPTKLVDHALVAALSLGESNYFQQYMTSDLGDFKDDPDSQYLKRITQMILNNAYEGIIRAAILQGRKRIYLTWLGGGAFRNPKKMISAAMATKTNQALVHDYGLEVYLIDWSSEFSGHPELVNWLNSSHGHQYKALADLPQEA